MPTARSRATYFCRTTYIWYLLLWLCCHSATIAANETDSTTATTTTTTTSTSKSNNGTSEGSAHPAGPSIEYEDDYSSFGSGFNKSGVAKRPPIAYKEGPLPTISDSVFSLIILIYVSVIFIFMFFSFCWKEPEPPPPDPAHKNIPMITSMLEEMEKQMAETKLKEQGMNGGSKKNLEDEGTEMMEIVAAHRGSMTDCEADVVVNVVTEKPKAATSTIKEEVEEEEAATQV